MSVASQTRPGAAAGPTRESKRLFGGVDRRLALVLLLVLPVVGAAIGAVLHPLGANRYRAVTMLIPPPARPGGASPEQTSHLLAGLVRAGAVRPDPLVLASISSAPGSVTTSVAPGGSLAVIARARTSADAEAIANSVAVQLVSLGEVIDARASGQTGIVIGDFARGLDGWGAPSVFSSSPRSLVLDHLHPRFGTADLAVNCGRSPGCGIAHEIPYAVVPGVAYVATVWVRATGAPMSISVVFGRGPREYTATTPVTVTGSWRRLSVSWTPSTLSSIAELDVQRASGRGAGFAVGAADLRDPTLPGQAALGAFSDREQSQLLAGDLSDTLLPARPDGVVSSATLLWAAGGLAVGLLLALAALGAGSAAAHRKQ